MIAEKTGPRNRVDGLEVGSHVQLPRLHHRLRRLGPAGRGRRDGPHPRQSISPFQAIRAIARNAQRPQVLVEGFVAMGIGALSYKTAEDVLSFISSGSDLDALATTPDDWSRRLSVTMLRGEQAFSVRTTLDIYEAKDRRAPGEWPTDGTGFRIFRSCIYGRW